MTKVVVTRALKGHDGDHYVGFSAYWDSIQDDSGGGADLAESLTEEEKGIAYHGGMTLEEASLATCALGLQADLAAIDVAVCGGSISSKEGALRAKATQDRYGRLFVEKFKGEEE